MNEQRLSRLTQVLVAPLVSEKSTQAGERENSYAFWVLPSASKHEIKDAVEYFTPGVKVEAVRTAVLGRTQVQFGGRKGRTKLRKKAYVKLAPGHEINFEAE
jgi:large subunit ribosomal protein L23